MTLLGKGGPLYGVGCLAGVMRPYFVSVSGVGAGRWGQRLESFR